MMLQQLMIYAYQRAVSVESNSPQYMQGNNLTNRKVRFAKKWRHVAACRSYTHIKAGALWREGIGLLLLLLVDSKWSGGRMNAGAMAAVVGLYESAAMMAAAARGGGTFQAARSSNCKGRLMCA
jgi:hypothetical protein